LFVAATPAGNHRSSEGRLGANWRYDKLHVLANGGYRRNCVVAGRSGKGLLTEPSAAGRDTLHAPFRASGGEIEHWSDWVDAARARSAISLPQKQTFN
jgi:hypothetical protein